MISIDPLRWAGALATVTAYAGVCLAVLRAQRARQAAAAADNTGNADWLVAYASQTGTGEYLAQQTADMLRTGGLSARALSVEQLDQATLAGASRMLFIASTYGEGDAPDSAARLVRVLGDDSLRLDALHYGLLALGDSSYANYCGYGRALEASLDARGAQPLFARIDADRGAPAAIADWRHHLSRLAGTSDAPDWSAPAYDSWRIGARKLLNPGSAGAPVYQVQLLPASGALPAWQAGDLVQIEAPAEPGHPREYSIASIAAEGRLDLLVRLHVREDGSHGTASGWLCVTARETDTVKLRLRAHPRFRQGDNDQRPLILIGNGTGIGGLRAHLQQRIAAGDGRNWLLFGERQAAHDFFYRDELAQWRRAGMLAELSLAFSRDGADPRYLQHALAQQSDRLREWVADGAAIYVCGSLQGMAAGVHEALAAALGQAQLDALDLEGRYRRDVY